MLLFPLVGSRQATRRGENLSYSRHSDLFGIVLKERFWTSQNDIKKERIAAILDNEDWLCRSDRKAPKNVVLLLNLLSI